MKALRRRRLQGISRGPTTQIGPKQMTKRTDARREREREREGPLSREKGGRRDFRAKETKRAGKKTGRRFRRRGVALPLREGGRGGGIKRGEIRGRFSRLAAICPFVRESWQLPSPEALFRPVRDTRLYGPLHYRQEVARHYRKSTLIPIYRSLTMVLSAARAVADLT